MRIGAADPAVNAFVLVDAEGARRSARSSETRWQAGRPLSPADGVPTSVKDLFLTRGWPTLRGSWLVDADGPWPQDAPAVARLREAGAVLLGKTTTPEFGWKAVTDSARFGPTGNPWDPRLTAGGSSGGSAAAVALGMGSWSIGTDGGGSVRIPAASTGTVALKPTYGLVPHYPPSPFGTLAHAGPMTTTGADAALLLDLLTGFDARDWSALPT
ncbi:MAG: amidase, partial [Microlunatus sp.]|nr:amidase [Microlunatus sp.]